METARSLSAVNSIDDVKYTIADRSQIIVIAGIDLFYD